MKLKDAIINVVNSAIVTFDNHEKDNSFLYSNILYMEKSLKKSGYIPVGISFNIPWNPYNSEQMAFVYEYDDEKYWCHIPRLCWERLICDGYGYDKADEVIDNVCNYNK